MIGSFVKLYRYGFSPTPDWNKYRLVYPTVPARKHPSASLLGLIFAIYETNAGFTVGIIFNGIVCYDTLKSLTTLKQNIVE